MLKEWWPSLSPAGLRVSRHRAGQWSRQNRCCTGKRAAHPASVLPVRRRADAAQSKIHSQESRVPMMDAASLPKCSFGAFPPAMRRQPTRA